MNTLRRYHRLLAAQITARAEMLGIFMDLGLLPAFPGAWIRSDPTVAVTV